MQSLSVEKLNSLEETDIHDIYHFWHTTALFRPVVLHQQVRKFATKKPKWAKKGNKFCILMKKYTTAGSGSVTNISNACSQLATKYVIENISNIFV